MRSVTIQVDENLPEEIARVLEPFADYRDWTLHYPLYINTFCFAHHLAQLMSRQSNGLRFIRERFIRHDWKRGPPEFTYRTSVEIFVAIEETLEMLKGRGHRFDPDQRVTFTRYNLKEVFYRTKTAPKDAPLLLITDIRANARRLVKTWARSPIDLEGYGRIPRISDQQIRDASDRGLDDFFEDARKIYLFSAPTAWLLRQQPTKYRSCKLEIEPIDTEYCFRCNSGAEAMAKEFSEAIAAYYQIVYSGRFEIGENLPSRYSRLAMTYGEPDPFSRLSQANGKQPGIRNQDLYKRILADFHNDAGRGGGE